MNLSWRPFLESTTFSKDKCVITPLTYLAVHFKTNTAQVDATDLTLVLWVAPNIAWSQIECNFFFIMVAKTEDLISTGNLAYKTK